MGTRSLTFVYERGMPIINMYRQYDGYPTGHGAELAEFLDGYTVVNGFGEKRPKLANGMGCLAAQMVAHFKTEVGNFYLYNTAETDCGQDYEYHLHEDKIIVKNYSGNEIFNGAWDEFAAFCSEEQVA